MQATAGGLGGAGPARRAFARRTWCGALASLVGQVDSFRTTTWGEGAAQCLKKYQRFVFIS